MPVKDDERAYLEDMRSLARDSQGREVFVGLTFEETEELLLLWDRDAQRLLSVEDRNRNIARFQGLHAIYESARQQVLAAEHIVRTEQPTQH